jgi:hypothetical protein
MLAALLTLVVAQAPVPALSVDAAPLVAEDSGSEVVLVKKRRAESGQASDSGPVLKGQVGWVVPGLAGVAIAAVFLGLPAFFLVWIAGPFTPFLFAAAVLWAALVVGAASAVVWLLAAALSDWRSGFLIPTLVGAAIGAGSVLLGGLVAGVILWLGWGLSGGAYVLRLPLASGPLTWGLLAPFYFFAWVAWTAGLVTAIVAGPMLAAYLYHRLGVPKRVNKLHVDVLTPKE